MDTPGEKKHAKPSWPQVVSIYGSFLGGRKQTVGVGNPQFLGKFAACTTQFPGFQHGQDGQLKIWPTFPCKLLGTSSSGVTVSANVSPQNRVVIRQPGSHSWTSRFPFVGVPRFQELSTNHTIKGSKYLRKYDYNYIGSNLNHQNWSPPSFVDLSPIFSRSAAPCTRRAPDTASSRHWAPQDMGPRSRSARSNRRHRSPADNQRPCRDLRRAPWPSEGVIVNHTVLLMVN